MALCVLAPGRCLFWHRFIHSDLFCLQSKRVQHNTNKSGTQSDPAAPSSVGTDAAHGRDLHHTSSLKVRDFTWDSSFKLVFVVVYSHAALKIIMKDRTPLGMGPASAEANINVGDLPQGVSRHSLPLRTKTRAVSRPIRQLGDLCMELMSKRRFVVQRCKGVHVVGGHSRDRS